MIALCAAWMERASITSRCTIERACDRRSPHPGAGPQAGITSVAMHLGVSVPLCKSVCLVGQCVLRASRAASSVASIMLDGSATPFPAMSNAVP